MDVMGMAAGSISQSLQNVQSAVSTNMLSKAMDSESQSISQLMQGLDEATVSASAMERSVNPAVGANFDARI